MDHIASRRSIASREAGSSVLPSFPGFELVLDSVTSSSALVCVLEQALKEFEDRAARQCLTVQLEMQMLQAIEGEAVSVRGALSLAKQRVDAKGKGRAI